MRPTGPAQPSRYPVPVGECRWDWPRGKADRDGLVVIGADLEPATIIDAYRNALFPMPYMEHPISGQEVPGWWSPPVRGVLDFADLRVTRSLRRSCRRYDVTINTDFGAVIAACADSGRDGDWISPDIRAAYEQLHELGWAHSVETWLDGELVGGLYGVQIKGLFAGESMFHRAADASKVALVALVSALEEVGASLLDTQWRTEHLATLGVREIARSAYSVRLAEALASEALSLASPIDPTWVARSTHFLHRCQGRPMEPRTPPTS